jgi:ribosomal protein S18 acetylase RimI-like enzyme
MTPIEPAAGPAGLVTVVPLPRGPLTPTDCSQLAALHAESLPDSLVVRLGRRYTEAFYRYLGRSDTEQVFLARDGQRVIGACVLSLSPETLTRRLVVHTPLLPFAVLALFRPRLFWSLLGSSRGASHGEAALPDDLPEVLLIFTSPTIRSRGLGAKLLAACEQFLAGRGHGRYLVRTVDDAANAALRFYARNGFVPLGRSFQHGRWFQVFQKPIADEPPAM